MAYKGPSLAELQKRKNPAALQARVQQLAANPGTRGLVDTSLLQRFGLTGLAAKRLLNERLAQPVVPGSTMTNRDLARESNAAMDVQYGPQRRLLERQQAQAPDYYDAYLAELKKAQAGATAQGAQTGQAIQALYGSGPMAPGSNQATLGQAQAGTAQLLGQTQANYQQALQNAVQSGKLKALADIGQRRADLAGTEGAANVQYRSKRRSEELTNVATAALANVKQDTAQSAQTQKGLDFLAKTGHTPGFAAAHPGQFAKDQIKRQHQLHPPKTAKNTPDAPYKYGYTKKEWLALPLSERKRITAANTKKPGDPKTTPRLTNTQVTKYVSQATQVASMLRNPPTFQPTGPDGKPKGKPRPATRAEILADIRAGTSSLGKGVDPRVINIGSSLASNRGKGIGPYGEGQAQSLGIPPGRFKRVKKVKPKHGGVTGPLIDAIGNATNS